MKKWWKHKAWPWLQKNWMWVLLPVGILVFVMQIMGRRKVEVISSELTGAAEVEREADLEADKRRDEAKQERDAELEEIREEHQEVVDQLVEEQREAAPELQENPEALNKHLLDVGRKVRGG